MALSTKLQPVIILLAAAMGIILGQNVFISSNSAASIEIFLMMLLFFIFVGVDIRAITKSFRNVKFSVSSLAVNFVWTPIFAVILGKLLLAGMVDIQVGFLMLLATPCTDWYLIFTGMARGNVPLGSSVLPLNLILQVLLLPVYLFLFMGNSISFNPARIVYSVAFVLILPLISANAVKWIVGMTAAGEKFTELTAAHTDNAQLLFLCLAVAAMFASRGNLLIDNPILFLRMLFPLAVFFAVNFIMVLSMGKKLNMPFEDKIALVFTTSARNSPISLAIATTAFPDHPMISLALVIGPLIELPILAVDSYILRKMRESGA
ncbi:MAG: bile acid:sodium symporter [Synergistaceae bacterium]|jgi:ACR3 family arsenite efflux pump ArsB|nr:bile acid:sodium symporter [Synergistaceae bacterium]